MVLRTWLLVLLQLLSTQWAIAGDDQRVDYEALLARLWAYKPELPPTVLSQAAGMQGNTERLERALLKMMRGEKVSLALMGGSISIRGWNHPDEAYMRQVHKWLESVFVPGCREEVKNHAFKKHSRHASKPANSGGGSREQQSGGGESKKESKGSWFGLRQRRLLDVGEQQHTKGGADTQQGMAAEQAGSSGGVWWRHALARVVQWGYSEDGAEEGGGGAAAAHMDGVQGTAGAGVAGVHGEIRPRERLLRKKDPYERDPRPDPEQDLHVAASAHYEETGHLCSMSQISLASLAVPAAGPGYAERCVLQHVPEDVDLVVMEFAVNDYMKGDEMSHPERLAYERILRHVMSLPNRPAFIIFSTFAWDQTKGLFPGSFEIPALLGQDKHQVIGEYYGDVQALSARAALYQLLAADTDMRHLIYIGKGNDMLHVNLLGHRWYADIIISYLRRVATGMISKLVAAQALDAEKGGGRKAGELLLQGALAGGVAGLGKKDITASAIPCGMVHGARGLDFPTNCSANGLKPPFFPGNEVQELGVCAIGSDFVGVVKEHEGWEWIDEGKAGVHKWGFVTTTVGAEITIEVDMAAKQLRGKAGSGKPVKNMLAWLIYLQGYNAMGIARMTCSGGCDCDEQEIDGMAKDMRVKATVPVLHPFTLKSARGGGICQLKVQVIDKMSRPIQTDMIPPPTTGHKFKLIGITTSPHPVWHLAEIVSRSGHSWADTQPAEEEH